jgi:uncharacterized membrane protein YgdD (TMEM256/DUF423 family)
MNKTILLAGLVLGGVAIILGAFGAHGLKRALGPDELNTFETGVKYQLYHALFLILLSMMTMATEGMKRVVFYLIISGVILFSFSIYLLATNSLTGFDFRKIGFVTPIGGLLMILGWGYLFFSILTKK